MLDFLLGLVSVLANNDPAQLANNVQQIDQKIISPDQRRDRSLANLPLLKPALLNYLNQGTQICQCKYDVTCVKTHVSATQDAANKFRDLLSGIIPDYLSSAQQTDYNTINSLIPKVSQMPMLCINAQDPKISIKDYYPESRLNFFLKELHTATQEICNCGNSSICLNKANVMLTTIYNNLDTSKITSNYTKGMWFTYDAFSRICLNLPNETNKTIVVPDSLLISETLLARPVLTLEQAKAYMGHAITITRKTGIAQSGILINISDKLMTLEVQVGAGKVNYYIPIAAIALIQGDQPKEKI